MFAYVGCFTTPDRGHGKGIHVYRVDPSSGNWSHVQLVGDVPNPSFLTLDPSGRWLYAVHGGAGFSTVSAFAVDRSSGRLSPLGSQDSGGENPVALSVSPSDPYLVVANYNAGTVAALPIAEDGSLGPPSDVVTVTGKTGPVPRSQDSPHPHDVAFDPAGRFCLVPDKGLDRVFGFRVDGASGRLVASDPPSVQSTPGAAPRHAAFAPDGRRAYVINEPDSTITTFAYSAERGLLEQLQVVSTLPPTFTDKNTTAEIVMAPSGRFVYGSNRGHDSIAIFAVDAVGGTLTPVGWESTRGKEPRYAGLDPTGSFLYAANELSDTIVTFRVDQQCGTLTPTGQVVETGSPVCIAFVGGPT